jgi:DNA-binding Lrp family transcriptional regulator
MNEYSDFLKEKLASIPHIATVQSSFVMKTMKED